jgi:hypothetical protein
MVVASKSRVLRTYYDKNKKTFIIIKKKGRYVKRYYKKNKSIRVKRQPERVIKPTRPMESNIGSIFERAKELNKYDLGSSIGFLMSKYDNGERLQNTPQVQALNNQLQAQAVQISQLQTANKSNDFAKLLLPVVQAFKQPLQPLQPNKPESKTQDTQTDKVESKTEPEPDAVEPDAVEPEPEPVEPEPEPEPEPVEPDAVEPVKELPEFKTDKEFDIARKKLSKVNVEDLKKLFPLIYSNNPKIKKLTAINTIMNDPSYIQRLVPLLDAPNKKKKITAFLLRGLQSSNQQIRKDLEIKTKELELAEEDSGIRQGSGDTVEDNSLSDRQIVSIMRHIKGFNGIVASDDLNEVPAKSIYKDNGCIGLIMNKLTNNQLQTISGHWVAIYIDHMNCEYYDPLADNIDDNIYSSIKTMIRKMGIHNMLKFKVNTIKDQSDNTSTCGFHACSFLINRLINNGNKSFSEASRFVERNNKSMVKGENRADVLVAKYKKFGYI